MIVMGVDSSSVSGACAVMRDGEVLADGFVNNGLTHSQTLLPLIADTAERAGISFGEVDLFAVTRGPGSFTGLRIGMATVKGLAAPKNTKCIGVSSLEAAAMNIADFDGVICAAIDARCGQVYNALFYGGDTVERICDDRAILIDDLCRELEKYEKKIIFVGDGAELCYNKFGKGEIADEKHRLILGESVARLGLAAAKSAEEHKMLSPVYLRLPQAQRELLLKQKAKGIEKK